MIYTDQLNIVFFTFDIITFTDRSKFVMEYTFLYLTVRLQRIKPTLLIILVIPILAYIRNGVCWKQTKHLVFHLDRS